MTIAAAACLSPARQQGVAIVVVEENGSRRTVGEGFIAEGNRTMVPLRTISESLGATVDYLSGTVSITLGSKHILLKIGETTMVVDSQNKAMDVAPLIRDSMTFVPLRFVAEELDATVEPNLPAEILVRGAGTVARPRLETVAQIPIVYDGYVSPRNRDWFASQLSQTLARAGLRSVPKADVARSIRLSTGRATVAGYPGRAKLLEIADRGSARHALFVKVHVVVSMRTAKAEAEIALATLDRAGQRVGDVVYRGYRDTAVNYNRSGRSYDDSERYGLNAILKKVTEVLGRNVGRR